MEWQPIETAPKDGAHILSYIGDDWPTSICWVEYEDELKEEIGRSGYWSYSEPLLSDVVEELDPTHWMPLPEPPEAD